MNEKVIDASIELREQFKAICKIKGHEWIAAIVHQYKPADREIKIVAIRCDRCGEHFGGATIYEEPPTPE